MFSIARARVSCPNCRYKFPLNRRKHERDKAIYCPKCRASLVNPFYFGLWARLIWFLRRAFRSG